MSLTSDRLRANWSYSLAQDFVPSHGRPLVVSTHLFGRNSDQVQVQIPLKRLPTGWQLAHSINAEETLLAVAVDSEIDVYDLTKGSFRNTLHGHVGSVDALEFHPTEPFELVSSSSGEVRGRAPVLTRAGRPEIIFWNIQELPTADDGDIAVQNISEAAQQGVAHGLDILAQRGMHLPTTDLELRNIQGMLEAAYIELRSLRSIPSGRRLAGRLLETFQSSSFSPDGRWLIVLPDAQPQSNSDDKWDLHIVEFATRKVVRELVGHRDAIMWAGFSPDQKRIGSCAWDGTFRIWDPEDGGIQHLFRTQTQNWAAQFSPDSTKFVGTDGHGVARIWDLNTGNILWKHDFKRWARQLDWSQDGAHIAIGTEVCGKLAIFDMRKLGQGEETEEEMVDAVPSQTRALSLAHLPEDMQGLADAFLSIQSVRFLTSSPTRLVYTTTMDQGIELYDLEEGKKWRFAPENGTSGSDFPAAWAFLESSGQLVAITELGIRLYNMMNLT